MQRHKDPYQYSRYHRPNCWPQHQRLDDSSENGDLINQWVSEPDYVSAEAENPPKKIKVKSDLSLVTVWGKCVNSRNTWQLLTTLPVSVPPHISVSTHYYSNQNPSSGSIVLTPPGCVNVQEWSTQRHCLHSLYFLILCSVAQHNHLLWKSLNTSLSCIDCVCLHWFTTQSEVRDNCCFTDCTLLLTFALFLCKPLYTVKRSQTSEAIVKNREGPRHQSNSLEPLIHPKSPVVMSIWIPKSKKSITTLPVLHITM